MATTALKTLKSPSKKKPYSLADADSPSLPHLPDLGDPVVPAAPLHLHPVLDDPRVAVPVRHEEVLPVLLHRHRGGLAVMGVVRARLERAPEDEQGLLYRFGIAAVRPELEHLIKGGGRF